ncbi:MAG: hypothetical protein QXS37_00680 [Candidatus Aenigmatarchaeota archaeon]
MNRQDSLINISVQQNIELKKELASIFLNFDVIMIKILQKFYFNGENFPNDVNSYYLQQLFSELRSEGLQINVETLRKRLESLVKLGLIDKVNTYPRIYAPVRDVEKVRNLLIRIKQVFL